MKKAQNVLEFALEGSKNVGASANLAFVERDPTERGPREQFEIDASIMIRNSIHTALSDARVILHDANSSRSSEVKDDELKSLLRLANVAERTISELTTSIDESHKRLAHLQHGSAR